MDAPVRLASVACHSALCAAALAAGCGAALAACGASASNGPVAVGTNPNSATSPLKLSECMRAHGVSGFPDPSAVPGGGVGFNGLGESNTGVLIVDGKTFTGPVVHQAEQACKSMLPPGGPPPKQSVAQFQRQLAFARCMRAHGATYLANMPSSGSPGRGSANVEAAPGNIAFDLNAPATKAALRVCGSPGR